MRFLLVLLLAGCSGTHRVYVGAGMMGNQDETTTPYVMYEREGQNNTRFQIGYHEYAHMALIKCVSWLSANGCAGVSYIPSGPPRDVHCSQLNARLGATIEGERLSLALWHDSNGRVCQPNKGFNFATIGYELQ